MGTPPSIEQMSASSHVIPTVWSDRERMPIADPRERKTADCMVRPRANATQAIATSVRFPNDSERRRWNTVRGGNSVRSARSCEGRASPSRAREGTKNLPYSRFCELYRGWASRLSVTMRQAHIGGGIVNLTRSSSTFLAHSLESGGSAIGRPRTSLHRTAAPPTAGGYHPCLI